MVVCQKSQNAAHCTEALDACQIISLRNSAAPLVSRRSNTKLAPQNPRISRYITRLFAHPGRSVARRRTRRRVLDSLVTNTVHGRCAPRIDPMALNVIEHRKPRARTVISRATLDERRRCRLEFVDESHNRLTPIRVTAGRRYYHFHRYLESIFSSVSRRHTSTVLSQDTPHPYSPHQQSDWFTDMIAMLNAERAVGKERAWQTLKRY